MQKEELVRRGVSFFERLRENNVTEPLYFSHHGNNYQLNTTAVGSSDQDSIAQKFYQAMCEKAINGSECTSIILQNNPPPSNWTLSWAVESCNKFIQLFRDAKQSPHVDFETCLGNMTEDARDSYNHQCKDNKVGTGLSIALLCFLVVIAALVAVYVGYRFLNRRTYHSIDPIPGPATTELGNDDEKKGLYFNPAL